MDRLAAALVALVLLIGLPSAISSEPTEDTDVQDVVYFGPDRPIFIRLHIQRDGKSFRTPWRDFAESIYRKFDSNGDGVLSGTEWDTIPGADPLVTGRLNGPPQGAASVRDNIDLDPPDERITWREFSNYLERVGAGPFALEGRYAEMPVSSPYPDDFLFQKVDSDGDGKLTGAELARFPELFKSLDGNDDDIVTRAEIQTPNAPFAGIAQMTAPASRPGSQDVPFLPVSAGRQLNAVVEELLQKYAHQGEAGADADGRRINVEKLALPREKVARFDSDADAELDEFELRRMLAHGVWSVIVTIRNDSRGTEQAAVEIDPRIAIPRAVVQPAHNGSVTLAFQGTELNFVAEADLPGNRREAVLQEFRAADRDKNGYVERSEVRRNPLFGRAFDALDADGDGMLFERELVAYIDQRSAAAESRTILTVQLLGPGLFDLLDLDHDGRLCRREVRNIDRRVLAWDRNGDGKVYAAEMPSVYDLTVARDQPQFPGGIPVFSSRAKPNLTESRRGPDWFRRMDQNRDGDVSRREFLGPPPLFERLDKDGDGFLSLEEITTNP
jgi:Ca2+-binding EF-hand superfamily protein